MSSIDFEPLMELESETILLCLKTRSFGVYNYFDKQRLTELDQQYKEIKNQYSGIFHYQSQEKWCSITDLG